MNYRITRPYQREFEDAPRVTKGGVVLFERLDAKNPAWFLGRDAREVAGYFPVAWFELDGSKATAKRDYDATEMTVCSGDWVSVVERHGRWVLVEKEDGAKGWIPEESIGAEERGEPDI